MKGGRAGGKTNYFDGLAGNEDYALHRPIGGHADLRQHQQFFRMARVSDRRYAGHIQPATDKVAVQDGGHCPDEVEAFVSAMIEVVCQGQHIEKIYMPDTRGSCVHKIETS